MHFVVSLRLFDTGSFYAWRPSKTFPHTKRHQHANWNGSKKTAVTACLWRKGEMLALTEQGSNWWVYARRLVSLKWANGARLGIFSAHLQHPPLAIGCPDDYGPNDFLPSWWFHSTGSFLNKALRIICELQHTIAFDVWIRKDRYRILNSFTRMLKKGSICLSTNIGVMGKRRRKCTYAEIWKPNAALFALVRNRTLQIPQHGHWWFGKNKVENIGLCGKQFQRGPANKKFITTWSRYQRDAFRSVSYGIGHYWKFEPAGLTFLSR